MKNFIKIFLIFGILFGFFVNGNFNSNFLQKSFAQQDYNSGINYYEYFPGRFIDIFQSVQNGWSSPKTNSKNIMTLEGCRTISSTNNLEFFIPTRTMNEWNSFKNNPPNGITIASCELVCEGGFHKEGNSCTPNSKNCTIENGNGIMNWNGKNWGSCEVVSCNTGYKKEGNACKKEITGYTPPKVGDVVGGENEDDGIPGCETDRPLQSYEWCPYTNHLPPNSDIIIGDDNTTVLRSDNNGKIKTYNTGNVYLYNKGKREFLFYMSCEPHNNGWGWGYTCVVEENPLKKLYPNYEPPKVGEDIGGEGVRDKYAGCTPDKSYDACPFMERLPPNANIIIGNSTTPFISDENGDINGYGDGNIYLLHNGEKIFLFNVKCTEEAIHGGGFDLAIICRVQK